MENPVILKFDSHITIGKHILVASPDVAFFHSEFQASDMYVLMALLTVDRFVVLPIVCLGWLGR